MASAAWVLVSLSVVIGFAVDVNAVALNQKDFVRYNTCHDILKSGVYKDSGSYFIFLNTTQPHEVFCRFEEGVAYTSIMQQKYGQVSFVRGWYDYVVGFGSQQSGDFWLGLSSMKRITDSGQHVLTVTMQDWQNIIKVVRYNFFSLGNNYRLSLSGYMSGAILPDDFSHNNGAMFATYDRPDVNNCAAHQKGGWWYNYCTFALPTGHYYVGGPYTPSGQFYDGIYFNDWHGYGYSLRYIKLELSYY